MSLQPAARAQAVAPFHVMHILEQAKALEQAGRDVIHMEVGEPDFPTPPPVVEAAQRALASRPMGYTAAAGLPELRRALAGWYARRYGADVDPRRIIVTPGGSGGLQLVLAALIQGGDSVLLTDPGYPCNRHLVGLAGGRSVPVPVSPEDGYRLAPSAVADRWEPDSRALMVATPANPTGSVVSPEDLAALHAVVQARDGALIVDEIYQGLVYEASDHTALALGEQNVFVVNSFSKFFGMTGWRLGWVVAPTAFVEVLERLAQNLFLAPPTLAQYGALAVLEPEVLPLLEARRDRLRERRDRLLAALADAGLKVSVKPLGAFYACVSLPPSVTDAMTFARELLDATAVAVTPGIDFGRQGTDRLIRIAYVSDEPRIDEGVARIRRFLAGA